MWHMVEGGSIFSLGRGERGRRRARRRRQGGAAESEAPPHTNTDTPLMAPRGTQGSYLALSSGGSREGLCLLFAEETPPSRPGDGRVCGRTES